MNSNELRNIVYEYFNLVRKNLPFGSHFLNYYKEDNKIIISYSGGGKFKRFTVTLDEILRQIREDKLRKLLE